MELTRDVKRAALEEMIIATLIQDQDAAGEILSELTERDFRYPEWQGLMVAARKLHAEGLPIIEGTLAAFYGAEGYLFSAHADQAARTKTPEDFRWLIGELKQLSMLDSIKAAAERLNTVESMDEAAAIVSKINELTSARRGVEIVTLGQAVQEYVDSIGQKPEFIRTGLRIFDDEVKLEKGCYCVIGGLASAGKTLLALQIAQMISLKYKVGFFSTETGKNRIATRTIASRSGIGNKKVIEKNLSKAEVEQVKKVAKAVNRNNMEIIPASNMTANDVRAITLSRKFDVIFVDYLQNIQSSNPRATGYERATEVTKIFQGLSRTGNVLVFALSQLSRPETRKDGKLVPPSMSSLRESGQIELDADVIALVYRASVDDNTSNRIMKIVKNRDGELFDLLLRFSGATQRLEVIDRLYNGQPSTVPSDEEPPAEWKEAPRAF